MFILSGQIDCIHLLCCEIPPLNLGKGTATDYTYNWVVLVLLGSLWNQPQLPCREAALLLDVSLEQQGPMSCVPLADHQSAAG